MKLKCCSIRSFC